MPHPLPPFVTLRDLAIVLRLLEEADAGRSGAYQRVADQTGKSRAFLNERIEHVEKKLGFDLLERADNKRRLCRLTPAGGAYRDGIAAVLREWGQTQQAMRDAEAKAKEEEKAAREAEERRKRTPFLFVGKNRTAGRRPDKSS